MAGQSDEFALGALTPNHAKFLHHLEQSESTRWLVARYLSERGNAVTIPPMRRAPSADQHEGYVDEGDLQIQQRIEVKRLSVDFTGPGDWPFGADFIVCAKHAFERACPRPAAFFVVAKSGAYAAVVRGSTSQRWCIKTRRDRRYENVTQEFLFAPLDCVEWVRLGQPFSSGEAQTGSAASC